MQIQQTSVKFFVEDATGIDDASFIPVFHGWIREHRLGDRLLIDVTDYRHVHHGPGVMLIGDQAHYGMDRAGGRLGLKYDRKRDAPGDPVAKLEEAFREALAAAIAMEQEPVFGGRLRFRTDLAHVRVVSRLAATNGPEAFAASEPALRAFFGRLFGGDVTIAPLDADPRAPFGVEVRAAAPAPLLSLLSRL
jgi:hypothetical protein